MEEIIMAKFCTYCGKPLEDGTICDCEQSKAAQAGSQGTPAQPAQSVPQGTPASPYSQTPVYSAPNPAVQSIGTAFKSLLTIVNKPLETLQNFVKGENFIAALILIGAQALIAAFFTLASLSSLGDVVNLGKMFGLTLLFSLVLSAVLYGSLFLFTIIFKGKIDAKTLLSVVAVRSVIVIPFMVLGLLIGFASSGIGILLFFIGEAFAFSYIYQAMKLSANLADNKLMFVIPLAIVVILIAYAIIMNGVAKEVIMDAVGGIFSGLSGLSGLY